MAANRLAMGLYYKITETPCVSVKALYKMFCHEHLALLWQEPYYYSLQILSPTNHPKPYYNVQNSNDYSGV